MKTDQNSSLLQGLHSNIQTLWTALSMISLNNLFRSREEKVIQTPRRFEPEPRSLDNITRKSIVDRYNVAIQTENKDIVCLVRPHNNEIENLFFHMLAQISFTLNLFTMLEVKFSIVATL